MRRLLLCTLVVSLLLCGSSSAVFAQTPDRREEVVWSVVTLRQDDYLGVFSPEETPTLYIMANTTHIFDVRRTQVYYWPIDRQYKPDWSRRNEVVEGTLELMNESGEVLERFERTPYTIQLSSDPETNGTQLITGEQALDLYANYLARRDAYLQSVRAYDLELAEYLDQMREDPDRTDLVEPQSPEPFLEAMNQPNSGFMLNLAPGRFQIRAVDSNGSPVAGSARELISITPRGAGVGYRVIPESKWTVPGNSETFAKIIYHSTETRTLYLQAHAVREYNQREFARTTNPQETDSFANGWLWVFDPNQIENVNIEMLTDGTWSAPILPEDFTVQQSAGSALGYHIRPHNPSDQRSPDFRGYQVNLPASARNIRIRLVDSNGKVVNGSERIILETQTTIPAGLYVLLVLPPLIGVGLNWKRRLTSRASQKQINQEVS